MSMYIGIRFINNWNNLILVYMNRFVIENCHKPRPTALKFTLLLYNKIQNENHHKNYKCYY